MKRTLIAIALFTLLPLAANAANGKLDYTYVEFGYTQLSGKGVIPDGDGFALRGAYNFNGTDFYVFGAHLAGQLDTASTNDSATLTELGGGYHHSLNKKVDLFGELALIRDYEFGAGDDNGYRLGFGARSYLTDKFELAGRFNYADNGDADSDTSITVTGLYEFADRWSGFVELDSGSDWGKFTTLGARYVF